MAHCAMAEIASLKCSTLVIYSISLFSLVSNSFVHWAVGHGLPFLSHHTFSIERGTLYESRIVGRTATSDSGIG